MTDGLRWLTVIGVGLLVPFGLIWWGLSATGQAAVDHWPLVIMGGALALLIWMLRSL